MPQPALSRELAEEAVSRVEAELRAGGRPHGQPGVGQSAVKAAAVKAVRDGWVNSTGTFETRLRVAKERYELEPDWSAFRPLQYLHRPPGAPVVPFQDHIQEAEPEGEPITVAVIGDAHDSPHLPDKSRFRWLGAFCAEHRVDRVVQIGDWMTLDCFSTHTDRATFEGLAKPTFEQDMASFHESQRAFRDGLGGHKPKLDCVLGNHEHRAWKWDNLHPESVSHGRLIEEAFLVWGWRTTPYGQYRFIDNVGFTHTPLNALGKPMGGVTGQQRAANAALTDVIHGDSHKVQINTAEKLGPFRSPTIYNAATALPPGFVEGYARNGGSTWRSGICLATIWGSHVRSWQFVEMLLLRKRYGRTGEAVAA